MTISVRACTWREETARVEVDGAAAVVRCDMFFSLVFVPLLPSVPRYALCECVSVWNGQPCASKSERRGCHSLSGIRTPLPCASFATTLRRTHFVMRYGTRGDAI